MYKKNIIVFLFTTIISAQSLENPNTSPLHILGKISKENQKIENTNSFNPEWVKDLKLLLPCKNIKLPKRSSRLPNAPRTYRNGTHRGIDFFSNWGTDVRAVAGLKDSIVDRHESFESLTHQSSVKSYKS